MRGLNVMPGYRRDGSKRGTTSARPPWLALGIVVLLVLLLMFSLGRLLDGTRKPSDRTVATTSSWHRGHFR